MNTLKPKLAMYWAASCGGCEIALANINEVLLEIDSTFDFMFCPCLLDTKRADIEALPDKAIYLTLFNGALRTEENLEMAELLRRKSELFFAFGACAASGGIPALANQRSTGNMLETVYCSSVNSGNAQGLIPGGTSPVPGGELELPAFLHRVLAVHEAVAIDYAIPGCPPEPEQIIAVIRHIASGETLPENGAMLGCSSRAVCDQCGREKRGALAAKLVRPFEALPEAGWCLAEQGFCCIGTATRGGCGALCPAVAMPCTGCYGAIDRDADPGAAVLSALAAVVDPGTSSGKAETDIHTHLRGALAAVADPLGTFYRYNLATTTVADRRPEVDK